MKNLFCLAILALIFTGCGTVKLPKTALKVEAKGWSVDLKSEKDTQLKGLNVDIKPDGSVLVSLPEFTATNSPVVIRETGKAQANTIDAQGRLVDSTGKVVGVLADGVIKWMK